MAKPFRFNPPITITTRQFCLVCGKRVLFAGTGWVVSDGLSFCSLECFMKSKNLKKATQRKKKNA